MVLRLLLCIILAGLTLYKYIDKLNELTALRLSIPQITLELQEIEERNIELNYQLRQFIDPAHLLKLARQPEYSHLRYPTNEEILVLPDGDVKP